MACARSIRARIWRVLATNAGIAIADSEIDTIVSRHQNLSGRDVKNLLKLASMVSDARGTKIDAGVVDFVKRFKPTADVVPYASQRRTSEEPRE